VKGDRGGYRLRFFAPSAPAGRPGHLAGGGHGAQRNESPQRVASLLNVALPTGMDAKPVALSALNQARQRLGDEPMECLFNTTTSH